LQPDGKIITIGRQTNAGISDITPFNIDGKVDTSFGFVCTRTDWQSDAIIGRVIATESS
jgi:hypothetical protein